MNITLMIDDEMANEEAKHQQSVAALEQFHAGVHFINPSIASHELRPRRTRTNRQRQQELEEKKRAFELRFGVMIGRRVRVQLIGETYPLEGMTH